MSVELATPAEVLEPGQRSLSEVAAALIQAHEEVQRAIDEVIVAAAKVGRILLETKRQHQREHGSGWREWVGENMPFTYATARLYMMCAQHQSIIEEQGWTRLRQVKEGLGALVAADHQAKGVGNRKPEWMKSLALEMHGEGVCVAHVAHELGVSPSAVKCWVDPEYSAKSRKSTEEINKRRIRAERALRDQEREQAISRAVRKAGAATQEAWAMAERMQDVLAEAQRETEDREAKRALSEAGVHYRQMRDKIVRALGVT